MIVAVVSSVAVVLPDAAVLGTDDVVVAVLVSVLAVLGSVVVVVVVVPDVAVLGADDPAVVDQYSAAVVASIGLQADLPGPEEGAGLRHVPNRHLTVLGH